MPSLYTSSEQPIPINDDGEVSDNDIEMSEPHQVEEDRQLALAIDASLQSGSRITGSTLTMGMPRAVTSGLQVNSSTRRRSSSPITEILDSCVNWMGERIVPGDTVELQYGDERAHDASKLLSGDFLRVYKIHQNWSAGVKGDISLKGILFRRTKYMKGVFTRKTNDLCMLLGSHAAAEKGDLQYSMVERPLDIAIKKRELCLTNEDFPAHSFRTRAEASGVSKHDKFHEHVLVSRWAYAGEDFVLADPHHLSERVFVRLTRGLCRTVLQPQDRFVSQYELRHTRHTIRSEGEDIMEQFMKQAEIHEQSFRSSFEEGSTLDNAIDVDSLNADVVVVGGESDRETPLEISRSEMEGSDQLQQRNFRHANPHSKLARQKRSAQGDYTFCDAFHGAGAVSQAAKMAGLNVILAVDKDGKCNVTYWNNHPDTELFMGPIDEFIEWYKRTFGKELPRIAILRIPPPCQFFSSMKRGPGKDDDANLAALFSVQQLVEAIRPRVVTLEQTDGIAKLKEHRAYFHALLGMFTANGYNLRSKVCRFADYESYQSRKRLIIFATCAGEPLMDFPPATRDQNGRNGLKLWRTVRDFLAEIKDLPLGPLHQPSTMQHRNELPRSLDDQFGTVLTHGPILHPSGRRDLTILERAVLQGFPSNYLWNDPQLTATDIVKQIGNAVPPVVFKIFLEHIRKHLEKFDAESAAARANL